MFWMLCYDIKAFFGWKKIVTFFLILLALCGAGAIYHIQKQETRKSIADKITIGISDEDNSAYSRMILNILRDNEMFMDFVKITYGMEEELQKEVRAGKLNMHMVIPKNFVQSIVYIENTPVRVTINSADTTKAVLLKNLLEAYEKYVASVQINCVTLYDIMKADGLSKEKLDFANLEVSLLLVATALDKNSFFDKITIDKANNIPLVKHYGYEILFLVILYVSMICGIRIMKEQKNGILSRMVVTGRRTVFFSEKLLLYWGINILLICILFLLRSIFLGQNFSKNSLLFCFIAGGLAVSFSVWFSSFYKTVQGYLLAMNMMIIFFMIIGGGIIPLLYLPQSFLKLSEFTPNYWFVIQMFSMEEGKVLPLSKMYAGMLFLALLFAVMGIFIYGRKEKRNYADT